MENKTEMMIEEKTTYIQGLVEFVNNPRDTADRIPLSGNSLQDFTKRTEKINGNTLSIYEKNGKVVSYDGVYWLFNGNKVEYLDEITEV